LRELSNFILTLPRPKIGAFSYTFDAVLLLTEKRKAANLLSYSSLKRQIMFNPKKLREGNGMVTKGQK
jgi:hypothetical protein